MPSRKIRRFAATAAAATAVNPNGIKKLLGNDVSTFFINEEPVFNNGPRVLPKNSPQSICLHSWAFDDFILAFELFAKVLQRLETYPSVNENWLEY